MSTTFKDLLGIQKREIVSAMTKDLERGKRFIWSNSAANKVTLSKDSDSAISISTQFDAERGLESALTIFNRAPDGYELADFLPYEKELAA